MIVPSVLFQLDLLRPLPALCAQSVTSIPYLANKHASRALQENTARLKDLQQPVETAPWALSPPAMPQPPTALPVCQVSTAALLACRCQLAIARLRHFPAAARKMNYARRVHQALPAQLVELLRAILALPGISRTKQVKAHACSVTQVHTVAAQAS